VAHGIARALQKMNAELRPALKKAGHIRRDPARRNARRPDSRARASGSSSRSAKRRLGSFSKPPPVPGRRLFVFLLDIQHNHFDCSIPMKVGIVGASGYAGETLVKLLLGHPKASSRASLKDARREEALPGDPAVRGIDRGITFVASDPRRWPPGHPALLPGAPARRGFRVREGAR